MKKRYFFSILLISFVMVSAFVIIKNTGAEKRIFPSYTLLPRTDALSYTTEWSLVKNNAALWESNIKNNPADTKSLLSLTALYIQEARVTGNLDYYNQAALELVEKLLEKDAKSFEALTFKATILLSQHQFEEAKKVAEQARQLYPMNAYSYGLIVDANVELGNYAAALEAADKMISIRPDLRSYSRIAYLREIHGDIPGAIEAMKLAVDAGAPGDENTEWCRVQMGKLYEQAGNPAAATIQYTIAAENRENYPYALAGLARIAVYEKNYEKALSLYTRADSILPDHTFKEGMIEVCELMNQPEKAKNLAGEILVHMKKINQADKKGSGQNEDHEMAHAYMGVGDPDNALKYALGEHERRPANIEVNETVALVYYRKAEYAKALPYIEKALATKCMNPELLCYAGLINWKTGNTENAKKLLALALKNNPVIPIDLKTEAEKVLHSL